METSHLKGGQQALYQKSHPPRLAITGASPSYTLMNTIDFVSLYGECKTYFFIW